MVVAKQGDVRPNPFLKHKIVVAERNADSPQWLRDLDEKGWAIIKGVVSPEKAAEYRDKAFEWLEGFKLGYKRDDPTTWKKENLPRHSFGGLYAHYSFAHAQFVWDIKSEPGVVKVFESIWGTDRLTVSFDGGNLSVPLTDEEKPLFTKPWPHADQSAVKPEFACVQGLLNILPNGPDDGGLVVMTNSVNKFSQVFEAFDHQKPEGGWNAHDHIRHEPDRVQWLEDHGCKFEKPNLDPGDFIIWDSRTVHYGAAPTGRNHRMAVYVCYKPDAWLTDEARAEKVDLFNKGWGTSHDPCTFIPKGGQDAEWNINFPYGRPVLTEQAKKAVGLVPY